MSFDHHLLRLFLLLFCEFWKFFTYSRYEYFVMNVVCQYFLLVFYMSFQLLCIFLHRETFVLFLKSNFLILWIVLWLPCPRTLYQGHIQNFFPCYLLKVAWCYDTHVILCPIIIFVEDVLDWSSIFVCLFVLFLCFA